MFKVVAIWIVSSPFVWVLVGNVDFVSLTILANALVALLIPALAGGLWWITASSQYIGEEFQNSWWENLLMAFIFGLSIWATVQSGKSIISMVIEIF